MRLDIAAIANLMPRTPIGARMVMAGMLMSLTTIMTTTTTSHTGGASG